MCHLQLRTLVFVAWLLAYVAFLLSVRKMWTGKYVRSPLARSLFMNMAGARDAAAIETQEVGLRLGPARQARRHRPAARVRGDHLRPVRA